MCNLVGEERAAKLIYLAVLSQMLDDPVSVTVKGLSSSGKSFTVDTVRRFIPPEALIVMTAMSERALVYMEDSFAHRTLILFEATALRQERETTESNQTAYFVRSLLSEGRIEYPVTVKEDGRWVTRKIVKEGPANLIVTITATSLHAENETRMLSPPADDSQAQTRAVLAALAAPERGEPDYREWHAYFRWLATANHRVAIPYARWLADELHIERSAAQRRLKAARERGYLKNTETKRGKPARYEPDAPLPGEVAILPARMCSAQCTSPCTAICEGSTGQDGMCSCAVTAAGVKRRNAGDGMCAVCANPLDPALASAGYLTHPGCDPWETP